VAGRRSIKKGVALATTYKDAGVDIEAGDALVERIKPHAAKTRRKEVVSGVGGFGGLFSIPRGYTEPVLVSGTDGVGTKLKLAFELNQHATVGQDLVAMSVNDVLTCGAEPLFFLDYFATAKLDVDQAEQVIAGIAKGCELSGCTLLGGETAELPGFYGKGEYELAGFAVGVVERAKILDGKSIRPGDAVLGMASSGLHSNGYSLARRLVKDRNADLRAAPQGFDRTLGDLLLEPTKIYVKDVLALLAQVPVKGLAHITGSGIPGNLPRCLPDGTRAVVRSSAWNPAPIFDWIRGPDTDLKDLYDTFNMGLGMMAVVAQEDVARSIELLNARGVQTWHVGEIEASSEAEPTAVIRP
jgi:phosphoribosylformylglycinamidine cyclo-ligase